jgi:transposase-like protein
MSPSNTEELVEHPSLAEAAVAGAATVEGADEAGEVAEPSEEELAIARELVRSARSRGVAMTGPGGMLKALTKTVIETALDEEMSEHLGYDRHDPAGRGSGNSRNGTRSKTVLTDNVGPVTVDVPRDRDSTFDPMIVKKRQRRLGGVETIVLSLVAKGLTTGEVSAHFEEIYGASLSKDTISRITDRVIAEMTEWMARPLEQVYAAVFIDAIYVKVRDGQVANRPFYVAIGVDLAGHKDVLGLWAGTGGGESAKFWLQVLTELRNRGVEDVFFVICDGLKGLPDSVGAAFPQAVVQTCVIHLIRNTFKYASKRYWGQIAADLKPIYRARHGRRPGRHSRSSRSCGASPIRRSDSCGATPGNSSCRSSTTEPVAESPEALLLPLTAPCGRPGPARRRVAELRVTPAHGSPCLARGPMAGVRRSVEPWDCSIRPLRSTCGPS